MGIETCGTGLKTVLATNVSSLEQVFAPNELPAKISAFPSALILLGDIDYNIVLNGGATDVTWRVIIFMGHADQPTSVDKLMALVELTGASIPGAVDTDPTLDGKCDASWVETNLGIGNTAWGDSTYITTEFRVKALV